MSGVNGRAASRVLPAARHHRTHGSSGRTTFFGRTRAALGVKPSHDGGPSLLGLIRQLISQAGEVAMSMHHSAARPQGATTARMPRLRRSTVAIALSAALAGGTLVAGAGQASAAPSPSAATV